MHVILGIFYTYYYNKKILINIDPFNGEESRQNLNFRYTFLDLGDMNKIKLEQLDFAEFLN